MVLVYPQRPSAALRRRSGEENDRVDAREERKDENLDRRPLHFFNGTQRDQREKKRKDRAVFCLALVFLRRAQRSRGQTQEQRDAFGNRGESLKKKKKTKEELFLRNNEERMCFLNRVEIVVLTRFFFPI